MRRLSPGECPERRLFATLLYHISAGNPRILGYTYIFSDNVSYGNGEALARFLKDAKMGEVVETKPVRNVNYSDQPDRLIKTWIWTPDIHETAQWFLKHLDEVKERLDSGEVDGLTTVVNKWTRLFKQPS